MVTLTSPEGQAFLRKIAVGSKPGASALNKALSANKISRHKLADSVIAAARLQASARALNASIAEEARKRRAAEAFKTDKARKKEQTRLKSKEKELRRLIKQLGIKVGSVLKRFDSINDPRMALKKRREALDEAFKTLGPRIREKASEARLRNTAQLVRTSDITALYRKTR